MKITTLNEPNTFIEFIDKYKDYVSLKEDRKLNRSEFIRDAVDSLLVNLDDLIKENDYIQDFKIITGNLTEEQLESIKYYEHLFPSTSEFVRTALLLKILSIYKELHIPIPKKSFSEELKEYIDEANQYKDFIVINE